MFQNLPKLIWQKGILKKSKESDRPAYSMTNAERAIFSRRISNIPHTKDTKAIKDPSLKKLKGDEMADFIVTASVFAAEGLVAADMLKIVKLQRDNFLLSENKQKTDVEKLTENAKKLGKLMERWLPQDSRPITTHKILVHFPQAVKKTGNLSECNGQWIEDGCLIMSEEIRRRGLKVKIEEVLTKSMSRQLALLRNRALIEELGEAIESPEPKRDLRFWDEGDENGNRFLGKGKHTLITLEERVRIAGALGCYGEKVSHKDIPIELVEFKRGFNGREYDSMKYTACSSSETTCVAVEFDKKDYFGKVTKFLKLQHGQREYRLVMLQLHCNANPSPAGGIPRVYGQTFFKKGNVVLLENLKRRVLFARKPDEDDYVYVLEVRGDLTYSLS